MQNKSTDTTTRLTYLKIVYVVTIGQELTTFFSASTEDILDNIIKGFSYGLWGGFIGYAKKYEYIGNSSIMRMERFRRYIGVNRDARMFTLK